MLKIYFLRDPVHFGNQLYRGPGVVVAKHETNA